MQAPQSRQESSVLKRYGVREEMSTTFPMRITTGPIKPASFGSAFPLGALNVHVFRSASGKELSKASRLCQVLVTVTSTRLEPWMTYGVISARNGGAHIEATCFSLTDTSAITAARPRSKSTRESDSRASSLTSQL